MTDENILSFSEDISAAEAPEPLPVGEYPATINGAEVKTSQSSGNRYLDLTLFIAPDDFPADYPIENNPDGASIHYRRCVVEDTPRARFNVRRLCEAAGVVASKNLNVNDFVGQQVRVKIAHDEYNGMPREDITEVMAS